MVATSPFPANISSTTLLPYTNTSTNVSSSGTYQFTNWLQPVNITSLYDQQEQEQLDAVLYSIRLVGAICTSMLTAVGVVGNGLLMYVLIRWRDYFGAMPFFVLVWQRIVSDAMIHFVQFYIVVPIMYAGTNVYGTTLWLYVPAALDTIGSVATLYFTFAIAANRFVVFLVPTYQHMFMRPNIYKVTGIVWLLVLIITAISYLLGCRKSFSGSQCFLYTQCASTSGTTYYTFLLAQSYLLPAIMFAMYLIIFVKIRRLKHLSATVPTLAPPLSAIVTDRRRSSSVQPNTTPAPATVTECDLIAQAAAICGCLELQTLLFGILLVIRIDSVSVQYTLNFVQNAIIIVNSSMNPIIFYIFNREIRRHAKSTLASIVPTRRNRTNSMIQQTSGRHVMVVTPPIYSPKNENGKFF